MAAQAMQVARATEVEADSEQAEYPKKRLLTQDEWDCIVKAGVFAEDERLQLIKGEIVEMAPIGVEHGFGVNNLNRLLTRVVNDDAIVWIQSPVRIGADSTPEPDVVLLKPRPDLSSKSPPADSDVILIVEVADSSVGYDRKVKGQMYAKAGIPEYWIVNLPKNVIEVYSEPGEGSYKRVRKARRGELLALPSPLKGELKVSDILPEA